MDNLIRPYISYGDKLWDKLSILLSYGSHKTDGYPTDLSVTTINPPSGIPGYKVTSTPKDETAYLIGHMGKNSWWEDGITLKTQYELKKDTRINLYKYDYKNPHTYLKDAQGNPVWSYTVPVPRREPVLIPTSTF